MSFLTHSLTKVFKKIVGNPQDRILKAYQPVVDQINALESTYESLSDEALKEKTNKFKGQLRQGKTLKDILPDAFALVRETSKRVLKMRHFDVQLIGGLVLHYGQIAEMKTGEGKTLVATLPAYLNALEEKGVYIVTVNDYLAKRDSEWMGQIFTFLGLSVGIIQSEMEASDRLVAYQSDITYGTNNEFGFDYLRDNLTWDVSQLTQVRRHYAIIDEVDSILIDEARTPLIISGPVQESTSKYKKVANVIRPLKIDIDFTLDEKHKNVVLTEEGIDKIEKAMGLSNVYSAKNMDMAHIAVQCLKALHLFKRDVDYVLKDKQIIIVDEFTGRLMDGRRYSDGLHQAIEAVEKLSIKEESQTLASITFQNYFRMFPKLAGMTGTAVTEAVEFNAIYGLSVLSIPTNQPIGRQDLADVVYKSKSEKHKAIVKEINDRHQKGQPLLVGTISIEVSEQLSSLLKQSGIQHNVLNAKHHEREAEIISNAGQKGSVTIATNMAGRGTDIVLGEEVKDLGGLFVLGSERHESRRIDNQLRGRSGRQGDAGATRFFVGLDDDLMRMFGSDRIVKVMEKLGVPEDTPIEHPLISKSIERAQSKVEKYHFSIRKQILQYDDVMNKQRETIYAIRHQILEQRNLTQLVHDAMGAMVNYAIRKVPEDQLKLVEKRQVITDTLQQIFPIKDMSSVIKDVSNIDTIRDRLNKGLQDFYQFRVNQYDPAVFETHITKRVFLSILDRQWMDHLHNMDVLREGIGLRSWGQRDPLIEYKREAFSMFSELMHNIYEEACQVISRAVIVEQGQEIPVQSKTISSHDMVLNHQENTKEISSPKQSTSTRGRNDPCSCGSGKKYKKCCMS
jgi:preprotein translocase subunit SecA